MSSMKTSSQTTIPNNPSLLSFQEAVGDDSVRSFYFQSFPIKDIGNYMVSSFYSEKILAGMDILIHLGAVEVSRQRKSVQSLMDREEIKEEQRIANQQRQRKYFLERQLQLLDKQTRPVQNQNAEQEVNQNGLVLSKEEHKIIADKFKREFMERSKRHQELVAEMTQKVKKEEETRKRQAQQQNKAQLQTRRERIDLKLQQNRRRKEQLRIFQQKSNEMIKKINDNKSAYQRLQLKYRKQIILPLIQQKQKKLRQIKQQKSFNLEQIKQHQKDYLQKKSLHESRRTIFRDDWTYVPPPKSQRLTVIMQQEELMKVKRIQQKKARMQENLARHAEYAAYLRRNFIPKLDPAKKEEIQSRVHKERIVRPESLDSRAIGLTYLQEARRKRKRIIRLQEDDSANDGNKQQIAETPHSEQKSSSPSTDPIKSKNNDNFYLIQRQHIKKMVNNSQLNNPEKIHMLSLQTDKLDASMKRKELELRYKKDERLKQQALQLLLSSIEAKIGIIETYA